MHRNEVIGLESVLKWARRLNVMIFVTILALPLCLTTLATQSSDLFQQRHGREPLPTIQVNGQVHERSWPGRWTLLLPSMRDIEGMMNGEFWRQLRAYVKDPTLSGRHQAYVALNSIIVELGRRLPDWSPGFAVAPHVLIAPGGWMYVLDDVHACIEEKKVEQLFSNIEAIASILKKNGKEFHFFISPDKTSVNTDQFTGYYAHLTSCSEYNKKLYTALFTQKGAGYSFALGDLHEAVGLAGATAVTYLRTDSHWNAWGRLNALQYVANTVKPGIAEPQDIAFLGLIAQKTDLYNNSLALNDQEITADFEIRRGAITKKGEKVLIGKNRWPILRYTAIYDPRQKMIEGKTIFITDSYFFHIGKDIAGYFADATLHYLGNRDEPSFQQDVRNADRVIIAILERNFLFGYSNTVTAADAPQFWQNLFIQSPAQ